VALGHRERRAHRVRGLAHETVAGAARSRVVHRDRLRAVAPPLQQHQAVAQPVSEHDRSGT
jgi:hypothetical protein